MWYIKNIILTNRLYLYIIKTEVFWKHATKGKQEELLMNIGVTEIRLCLRRIQRRSACTWKSNRLFEDAILPKLCGIYIPICHQCDRFKTDEGMCNEYGTSDAVPEICGTDWDDYCGCSGCVYLYPVYGIYLWRKEINKIIKGGCLL